MDAETEKPRIRIWVVPCPFGTDGAPVLGSSGDHIRKVVIIPAETWAQLCRDNPSLAATEFEVRPFAL